ADGLQAAIRNIADVLTKQICVKSHHSPGKALLGVMDLEVDGAVYVRDDSLLVMRGPKLGIFLFEPVDEVDAEVEVDGLVTKYVLELLAHARHAVLAVAGEDHDEAWVDKDPCHDHVVAHEVFEKLLGALERGRREA